MKFFPHKKKTVQCWLCECTDVQIRSNSKSASSRRNVNGDIAIAIGMSVHYS